MVLLLLVSILMPCPPFPRMTGPVAFALELNIRLLLTPKKTIPADSLMLAFPWKTLQFLMVTLNLLVALMPEPTTWFA